MAVKVLRHLDDDGIRRFQREAQILANLGSHENLAVIHRFDETASGNPCFIMEFVSGGTLADTLKRVGAVEAKTAIAYAQQVARALVHTHARGIVHRDIKPSNILLTSDGQAKLSDFGIAVIRSSSATLNAATFEHAAPEVFLDHSGSNDERIDLYSLASTLFTLIDGKPPYHVPGEASHEALLNRVLHAPTPVVDRAPQLDGFWPKALAKDPAERFQTAAEMLTALTALGRETPQPPRSRQPVKAAPPPPGTPPPPPSGPHPAASQPAPPTRTAGQLSPQELAVVDSYATSTSVEQRRKVAKLTSTQAVLFNLAQDGDDVVATTAIERLTDQTMLARLLEQQRPRRTRILAARQVNSGPLASQVANDPDPEVRAALADGLTDPAIIGQLIRDPSEGVRSAVISQIDNPDVLQLIAESPEVETRRAIAQHVKSVDLRITLAHDADPSVRQVAMAGLDPRSLLDLAASAEVPISRSAMELITDPESLHRLSRDGQVHVQTAAVDRLAAAPNGSATLMRIATDGQHPQWQRALDHVGDQQTLAELAQADHPHVAEYAEGRMARLNHRNEQLASVRVVVAAVVLFAVVLLLVRGSLWPLSFLLAGGAIAGYWLYSQSEIS